MYLVTSSNPTGTMHRPENRPITRFPAPPRITAAKSTTVSAYPTQLATHVVM